MIVLVLGVTLTALSATSTRADITRAADRVMDRRALFVSQALEVSVRTVMTATTAHAGLIMSSDEVRPDEFDRFVRTAGQHGGTAATAYIPQVAEEDWPAFIEEVRRADPDFAVFRFDGRGAPVTSHPTRWPVLYALAASPFEPDLRGFDAGSDPVWAELLARTERQRRTSISELTQLFGVPDDWGFVAASPVLEDLQVTGYTVEVARLSGLVEAELADSLSDVIDWQVRELPDDSSTNPGSSDSLSRTDALQLGGRTWEIVVSPTDQARADLVDSGLPLRVGFGLALTLVAALASHLAVNAIRARRESRNLRWIAEEKDAFLTALSHELRTPLTVVVGMADILEEATLSHEPEIREYVGMVQQEGHALARLVDDLLLLGRLDAEVLPMRPELLDVRWEVERIVNELTPPGEALVRIEGSGFAWADPLRLRHIIRHLYSNALRHGGDTIFIRLTRQESQTAVLVSDDGPGIPDARLAELFMSARGTKDSPGGPSTLGLGLRVSHRLARALGGTLTHRREEGMTIFELRIPSTQPSGSQSDEATDRKALDTGRDG